MASNHTQHYGLCQWEATDAVLRTDFNEDNQKIDTALKAQAGSISDLTAQMANKANTGAVNSLAEEVAQKADQSDLEAAVSRVTTLENKHSSDVAALRSENCWVKLSDETLSSSTGSYSYTIENPEQYAELKFMFSVASGNGRVDLTVNNGALIYSNGNSNGVDRFSLQKDMDQGVGGTLRVFPMGTSQYVAAEYEGVGFQSGTEISSSSFPFALTIPFSQLRSLKIYANMSTLQGGSRFLLYGLKK